MTSGTVSVMISINLHHCKRWLQTDCLLRLAGITIMHITCTYITINYKIMYYLYHIPGKKIGVTRDLNSRVTLQQGYRPGEYEVLLTSDDIDYISDKEIELQKSYGYKVAKSVLLCCHVGDRWTGCISADQHQAEHTCQLECQQT